MFSRRKTRPADPAETYARFVFGRGFVTRRSPVGVASRRRPHRRGEQLLQPSLRIAAQRLQHASLNLCLRVVASRVVCGLLPQDEREWAGVNPCDDRLPLAVVDDGNVQFLECDRPLHSHLAGAAGNSWWLNRDGGGKIHY